MLACGGPAFGSMSSNCHGSSALISSSGTCWMQIQLAIPFRGAGLRACKLRARPIWCAFQTLKNMRRVTCAEMKPAANALTTELCAPGNRRTLTLWNDRPLSRIPPHSFKLPNARGCGFIRMIFHPRSDLSRVSLQRALPLTSVTASTKPLTISAPNESLHCAQ